MIREDAANFQRQLIHLFRVFEVDAAVTAGLIGKDDWGVSIISTDAQLKLTDVESKPQKPKKKKDVLSG